MLDVGSEFQLQPELGPVDPCALPRPRLGDDETSNAKDRNKPHTFDPSNSDEDGISNINEEINTLVINYCFREALRRRSETAEATNRSAAGSNRRHEGGCYFAKGGHNARALRQNEYVSTPVRI
jgi:hypothetical protein